jgi:hypothetical protein
LRRARVTRGACLVSDHGFDRLDLGTCHGMTIPPDPTPIEPEPEPNQPNPFPDPEPLSY